MGISKYERERMGPMLWATFAAAATVDPRNTDPAGKADAMLAEFDKRFPIEEGSADDGD